MNELDLIKSLSIISSNIKNNRGTFEKSPLDALTFSFCIFKTFLRSDSSGTCLTLVFGIIPSSINFSRISSCEFVKTNISSQYGLPVLSRPYIAGFNNILQSILVLPLAIAPFTRQTKGCLGIILSFIAGLCGMSFLLAGIYSILNPLNLGSSFLAFDGGLRGISLICGLNSSSEELSDDDSDPDNSYFLFCFLTCFSIFFVISNSFL